MLGRPSIGAEARIGGETEPTHSPTETTPSRDVFEACNPPSPVRNHAGLTAKTPRNRGDFSGCTRVRAGRLYTCRPNGGASRIRSLSTLWRIWSAQTFEEKVEGAQEKIYAIAPARAEAKAPKFKFKRERWAPGCGDGRGGLSRGGARGQAVRTTAPSRAVHYADRQAPRLPHYSKRRQAETEQSRRAWLGYRYSSGQGRQLEAGVAGTFDDEDVRSHEDIVVRLPLGTEVPQRHVRNIEVPRIGVYWCLLVFVSP